MHGRSKFFADTNRYIFKDNLPVTFHFHPDPLTVAYSVCLRILRTHMDVIARHDNAAIGFHLAMGTDDHHIRRSVKIP